MKVKILDINYFSFIAESDADIAILKHLENEKHLQARMGYVQPKETVEEAFEGYVLDFEVNHPQIIQSTNET